MPERNSIRKEYVLTENVCNNTEQTDEENHLTVYRKRTGDKHPLGGLFPHVGDTEQMVLGVQ